MISLQRGAYAFTEQQPPDALWVLLAGELCLRRTVAGREVVMETSSTPGVWAGWLPVFDGRMALSMQATRPSRLLRIPSAAVQHMLLSGYPIATHLIAGIYEGIQNLMRQTRQQEKTLHHVGRSAPCARTPERLRPHPAEAAVSGEQRVPRLALARSLWRSSDAAVRYYGWRARGPPGVKGVCSMVSGRS